MRVSSKKSKAYAIIADTSKPDTKRVYYYRSNRIKNPEVFLSKNPEHSIKLRFESAEAAFKAKAERIKATAHTFKVGDILYSSWGYSMTIVDFYKIIETRGKSTVVLEEMSAKTVEDHGLGGTRVVAGALLGKRFTARVNKYGYVKINSSSQASIWDGKSVYDNRND